MKKIGILKADPVHPKLSGEFGEYDDMITKAISTIIGEFTYRTYDVQHFEYPEDIDEVDAYFITGSSASAYEEIAWIHQLCDFVRVLDKHKKKMIGLCFGHQLIAHALGGKVALSGKGWNIGIKTVSLTKIGQQQLNGPTSFNLINSHRDQVLQLPKDCITLAGNTFCPIYMYHKEQHIFCIQGHIEMTKEYAAQLYALRKKIFTPTLYQEAINSFDASHDYQVVTKWITDFIWHQ